MDSVGQEYGQGSVGRGGLLLLPVGGVRWWIAGLKGLKQLRLQWGHPRGVGWKSGLSWDGGPKRGSTHGLSHIMVLTSFMGAGFPRAGTSRAGASW